MSVTVCGRTGLAASTNQLTLVQVEDFIQR